MLTWYPSNTKAAKHVYNLHFGNNKKNAKTLLCPEDIWRRYLSHDGQQIPKWANDVDWESVVHCARQVATDVRNLNLIEPHVPTVSIAAILRFNTTHFPWSKIRIRRNQRFYLTRVDVVILNEEVVRAASTLAFADIDDNVSLAHALEIFSLMICAAYENRLTLVSEQCAQNSPSAYATDD